MINVEERRRALAPEDSRVIRSLAGADDATVPPVRLSVRAAGARDGKRLWTCTCYSMSMKTERLQVLIDRPQRERLERIASARGVSVASLVRRAIDAAYPSGAEQRAALAADILSAPPMEVPDLDDLRDELDRIRGGE